MEAHQYNLSPKPHHDDEREEEEKKGNNIEWKQTRILGQGSYGIVYLAFVVAPQEAKGKFIAVKSSRPSLEYSLEKEASILQSLIGCEAIIWYIGRQIAMDNEGHTIHNLLTEVAPLGSLGDLIKKEPMLEDEAKIHTRMILEGLSCIHHEGIVHCDLKPNNILLFPPSEDGANNHLKIADFGLPKTKDEARNGDSSSKMEFRSTPSYTSPESVDGDIDTPMDIWSLGCIVVEMITGSRAWYNLETRAGILCKFGLLREPPVAPNVLSEECKDFLRRCFVMDPSHRWTADMLLNHPFAYKFKPYDIFRGFQGHHRSFTSFFSYEF